VQVLLLHLARNLVRPPNSPQLELNAAPRT
jgi:hypothetical protein